jgi:hypothetical protein
VYLFLLNGEKVSIAVFRERDAASERIAMDR